jgi:glyoxylase-like metal-dependent hydrolase (beta-lactamase superfamily II)
MSDPVRELVETRPDFFAVRPASPGQPAERITDSIYMSRGLSNAYLLRTAAGRVVINTGMGFEAPAHKAAFDAVCPSPTPWILLTQGHVDHVGGVALFRGPGTRLVAQRNNAACQRDDERIRGVRQAQAYIWFKSAIDAGTGSPGAPRAVYRQDTPVPDVLFDDRLDIDCGGVRLELHATPGGETVDSCVVWLPAERILFSGNVFGPLFPHFPNFNTIRGDRYRFFEPYLESLRRIRALEPEVLVTGHFEPVRGAALIRACLDRLEAAVEHVHTATLHGMNAGEDIWTLMREIVLPDSLFVGQGYGKASWAVRTIWESYMGWFKARATSELYPTQPAAAWAELVALAGVEAVTGRGRARLDAGDPETACLLAEAALAADPGARSALSLALDAHRALLARPGAAANFWEAGWLRHHIARLEAALA